MGKKVALLLMFLLCQPLFAYTMRHANHPFVPLVNNQTFRDEIINYVRSIAIQKVNQKPLEQLKTLDATWSNLYQKANWSIAVTLYHAGMRIGEGQAHNVSLAKALEDATEKALEPLPADKLLPSELNNYRFKVIFNYYPARQYAFIEYNASGLELTGSRVAVRKIDKALITQQITHSAHYLLRVMDPKLHGFFKFYDAATDKSQDLLRTIYSSSSLYTLLLLYHQHNDPQLARLFKPIATFILSNQAKDGPNKGGFYYGFNPVTKKKSCLIVVGTTSKTIFTLLELHRFYSNDTEYLTAAKQAGDWLLTRINADGTVRPVASCNSGKWRDSNQQSFLYSGQVLSALSRLYNVTREDKYLDGAHKIAHHFLTEVAQQGVIVGDDYRPANSISTSWVMMSLIDIAKVDSNPRYRATIEQLASAILARQITDKADIYSNGRYLDAMTASGNGWINEVMGVLYSFCTSAHMNDCQRYRAAMLITSRWLLQNAYSKANTYNVKNPSRAIGGFMTNFTTQSVRTDAVCHGVNSLIMLAAMIGDDNQVLLNLPERPLVEILPLLRAGRGDS